MLLRRIVQTTGVLAIGVVVGAGCDRAEAPSGPLNGTWSGTITDVGRGRGNIRLVLEHRGIAISGSIQTTFQDVVDREGPVTGSFSAGTATIYSIPAQPLSCAPGISLPGTIAFTMTAGPNRLTGTYVGFTCGSAVGGTVELTPSV